MTQNDQLLRLAERLERSTGPDRELDFAILRLADPRAEKTGPLPGDPKYTASLDAAMTLIPEGLYWTSQTDRDGAVMTVGKADSDARGIFYTDYHQATARTPALALASAALKAHSRPRQHRRSK